MYERRSKVFDVCTSSLSFRIFVHTFVALSASVTFYAAPNKA